MKNLKRHLEYKEDFLLFAKNEANILTPFGVKKVELYDFQLDLLESIKDTFFDLIVQSRQMGVTNLLALYISWVAIFDHDKEIAILSHNKATSDRILAFVRTILNSYSCKEFFDYENMITKDCKSEFKLTNGNSVRSIPSSVSSFKGRQIDILVVDNAAYIKNLSTLMETVTPVIFALKDSKLIISSSPKKNSHFNKMVLHYEEDKSIKEDKKISLNYLSWNLHPNRDKEWFEKQCIILGLRQELINEELNCVVTSDEHEQKNKTISLRLTNKWLIDIKTKIGDELSISDYIRSLIEKDLNI
jgi:hypothetical protein